MQVRSFPPRLELETPEKLSPEKILRWGDPGQTSLTSSQSGGAGPASSKGEGLVQDFGVQVWRLSPRLAGIQHPLTFPPPPRHHPPSLASPPHLHKVPINTFFSLCYLRTLNSLPAREPASHRPLGPQECGPPLTLAPRETPQGLQARASRGSKESTRRAHRGADRCPQGQAGRTGTKAGGAPVLRAELGRGPFSWETRGVEIPRSSSSSPRTPPPPRRVPSPLPSHLFRSAAPRQTRLSAFPPLPSPLPKLPTPRSGGTSPPETRLPLSPHPGPSPGLARPGISVERRAQCTRGWRGRSEKWDVGEERGLLLGGGSLSKAMGGVRRGSPGWTGDGIGGW